MPIATVLAHEDQHGRAQMSTSRLRRYDGPAILSYGFRPFFLLGSIYSGLAILVWLPVFRGELELASALTPRDWHVHEMLYGYLPAVITGFLLTAVPNWTGRLPLRGRPLLALVLIWLAGRIAVTISAPGPAGPRPRSWMPLSFSPSGWRWRARSLRGATGEISRC